MPNYASITLVGHLGKDPQSKTLNDGQTVVSFSIATSRKRGDTEITTWWNCSLFGKRGEALARFLKKGDPVLVHGEPVLRKYKATDGTDGVSLDVTCSDFAFIGSKSDSGAGQGHDSNVPQQTPQRAAQGATGASGGGYDEDVPFSAYQAGWIV
jgi:single-strand DNA-binding protein